jgi:hypothetical protein
MSTTHDAAAAANARDELLARIAAELRIAAARGADPARVLAGLIGRQELDALGVPELRIALRRLAGPPARTNSFTATGGESGSLPDPKRMRAAEPWDFGSEGCFHNAKLNDSKVLFR